MGRGIKANWGRTFFGIILLARTRKTENRPLCYFQNPGAYFLFSHMTGIGNQCDVVASSIMDAGGMGCEVKWRPKTSFKYAIKALKLEEREFE